MTRMKIGKNERVRTTLNGAGRSLRLTDLRNKSSIGLKFPIDDQSRSSGPDGSNRLANSIQRWMSRASLGREGKESDARFFLKENACIVGGIQGDIRKLSHVRYGHDSAVGEDQVHGGKR